MEQPDSEFQEDLGMGGKIKNWLQDNIRIVISVLIVVAIAGGIYSYSKRSDELSWEEELAQEQSALEEESPTPEATEEAPVNVIGQEKKDEEKKETQQPTPQVEQQPEEIKLNGDGAQDEMVGSEETQEAFVEVAAKGDGTTKMARRALKSYLEKNNDSGLTAEHKIYIEDYLRKNINHPQKVVPGEKISFSKDLIKTAIEQSKTLNQKQLDNLKKYSSRVVW